MAELFFIPIGIVVGIMSGFLGIGGGIIIMPILLLFGLSADQAVSTSLMFTLGTSLSGAATHTKMKNVNWKVAANIGIVGALVAQASKFIVIYISGRYDWLLNICLIVLLSYFAWGMHKRKNLQEKVPRVINPYVALAVIGVATGFLSSLLGIGGGFIALSFLMLWQGFDSRKAIGTSLAIIIFVSAGGVIGYGMQFHLNYLLGLYLIIGAFMGTPVGAKLTAKFTSEEIKKIMGRLYVFVIASLAVDLVSEFYLPVLKWLSLSIILAFLVYLLITISVTIIRSKRAKPAN